MRLFAAVAILLLAFSGCADKDYSKQKPDAQELAGSWWLREASRRAVQSACNCSLGASEGFVVIRPDGSASAQSLPGHQEFKVHLFSGEGSWQLVQFGKIWKIEVALRGREASGALIHIMFDVGHDGGVISLNEPIDDPDGQLMYFDKK